MSLKRPKKIPNASESATNNKKKEKSADISRDISPTGSKNDPPVITDIDIFTTHNAIFTCSAIQCTILKKKRPKRTPRERYDGTFQ